MRAIYTRHFPFFSYALVPLVVAVFTLLVYSKVVSLYGNHQELSSKNIPAQRVVPICDISADETIVRCGTSTVLSVDPGIGAPYQWSDGDTTFSTTVTQSGQYWWQAPDFAHNSVINGDFSGGNAGFTSQYNYIDPLGSTGWAGALTAEDYYTVSGDPHISHANFFHMGDHTTGTGNMMVVNGAPQYNQVVWNEDITVIPNTVYIFSIWAASVNPAAPATLTFSINGTLLGVIQLTPELGKWQNFTVQWTTDGSTTANIGIVNQNVIASGNDFALDDIVFAPLCKKTFNVTLNPLPPKPAITNL